MMRKLPPWLVYTLYALIALVGGAVLTVGWSAAWAFALAAWMLILALNYRDRRRREREDPPPNESQ